MEESVLSDKIANLRRKYQKFWFWDSRKIMEYMVLRLRGLSNEFFFYCENDSSKTVLWMQNKSETCTLRNFQFLMIWFWMSNWVFCAFSREEKNDIWKRMTQSEFSDIFQSEIAPIFLSHNTILSYSILDFLTAFIFKFFQFLLEQRWNRISANGTRKLLLLPSLKTLEVEIVPTRTRDCIISTNRNHANQTIRINRGTFRLIIKDFRSH
jgi:hypothetical protein